MTHISSPDQGRASPANRGYEPGIFNYLRWLYFRFNGRARLREIWFGHIGFSVVLFTIALTAVLSSGIEIADRDEAEAEGLTGLDLFFQADAPLWLSIVGIGVIAALLFCPAAIQIKRLHDRNKSGWWLAFFWGVPFVLGIAQGAMAAMMESDLEDAAASSEPSLTIIMLGAFSFVVSVWWFIELFLIPGTKGDNQYGPDVRDKPSNLRFPKGYESPKGD